MRSRLPEMARIIVMSLFLFGILCWFAIAYWAVYQQCREDGFSIMICLSDRYRVTK